MRVLPLLLLATCSTSPAIRPVDATGLRGSGATEIVTIHGAEQWEEFLARQPTEPGLRLRQLTLDFERQSFVFACVMVTSGSTKVTFNGAMEDGDLTIEVRTRTPSGPVRADIRLHRYAAIVDARQVDAVLLVDGRKP
ncbi:MAG: hypothetical protein ACYTHK_13770 [Planctomycetota bacterium]|jgi:hypothetical protein